MNQTVDNIPEDPFPSGSVGSSSASPGGGSSGSASGGGGASVPTLASPEPAGPAATAAAALLVPASSIASSSAIGIAPATASSSLDSLSITLADGSSGPGSGESMLSMRTTSPLLHPAAMPLSSLPGLASLSGHSLHLASKYFSALPSAGSTGAKRALAPDSNNDSENDEQSSASLKRRKITLIPSPSFPLAIKSPLKRRTESDDEGTSSAANELESAKRLKLQVDAEETPRCAAAQPTPLALALAARDSHPASAPSALSLASPPASSSSSNGLLLIEPEEELFCVHIDPILGTAFDVYLSPLDTLGDFKFAIFEEMSIYPDHQILYFKNDNLSLKPDSVLLSDLGIQHGSRMKLFISIKGGPGAPFLNASLPDSHFFFDRVFPLADLESSNAFLYKTDDDELVMVELSSPEKGELDLEKELAELIKEKEQEERDEAHHRKAQQRDTDPRHARHNASLLEADLEPLASLGSIRISSPPRSLLTASAELAADIRSSGAVSPGISSRPTSLKCQTCCKKLRLTNGFQCKCGNYYCSEHRYSDRHTCTFDFLAKSRIDLKRHNLLIVKDKI